MAKLASVVWQDATTALLLGVHGAQAPTDEEWDRYCGWIPELFAHPNPGCLVLTDGGAPTGAQREQLRRRLGRACWTAVITDKALVRGVVTAIRWFNPTLCAFAPWEVREALKFLNVLPEQIHSICLSLRALDQQLEPRSRVLPEALLQLDAPDLTERAQ